MAFQIFSYTSAAPFNVSPDRLTTADSSVTDFALLRAEALELDDLRLRLALVIAAELRAIVLWIVHDLHEGLSSIALPSATRLCAVFPKI